MLPSACTTYDNTGGVINPLLSDGCTVTVSSVFAVSVRIDARLYTLSVPST